MLHLAASYGHREVAAYLFKLGMNVLLKNKRGKTPVDIAHKFGHITIVDLLMVGVSGPLH